MPDKPPIRLHSKPALTARRRKLRRRLTPAEAALWNVLKGAKLDGRKFRRQHSVGSFILDFYCVEESLAIELDGQIHRNEDAEISDLNRTAYLRKAGIRVLRFENYLIFDESHEQPSSSGFQIQYERKTNVKKSHLRRFACDHLSQIITFPE